MSSNHENKLIKELCDILDKLSFYKGLSEHLLNKEPPIGDPVNEIRAKVNLRIFLLGKIGKYRDLITKLTGTDKTTIYEFGKPRMVDMWTMGLREDYDHRSTEALNDAIVNLTMAIGKLKSDIEEGIRDKRGKLIEKPATMADTAEATEDYEERQEKQSLGRESRKHLQGTPEEIAPHIVRVAQEFQFQGFKYLAQELSYKSSQHSKYFQILCGEYVGPQISFGVDAEDGKHPQNRHIGEIILQSLPNTRTVFISREKSGDLVNAALYFNSFLERLSLEFKNLGVEETTLRKTWRRFSGIIELWNKLKP